MNLKSAKTRRYVELLLLCILDNAGSSIQIIVNGDIKDCLAQKLVDLQWGVNQGIIEVIQWRPFIARFIIANILYSSILISLHNMLSFELTKDTPYLALSGELWSVFYEYFNRNWPCYKGFSTVPPEDCVDGNPESVDSLDKFIDTFKSGKVICIHVGIFLWFKWPNNQHCFCSWLGVVSQQAVSWANIDPGSWRHF